ncbi:MAG: multicopper oxidase domain-containing protein, partial [Sphingomonadaceae bacterium]|nr:multicopper oxidase domain-containing protein [Sphingomonadaceae bacterium]
MPTRKLSLSRRQLIRSTAALGAAAALPMPGWARGMSMGDVAKGFGTLSGKEIDLAIGHGRFSTGGRSGHAFCVNGTVPGPLIRLKEGQNVKLNVTNHLDEDSSIHWHGLLVPFQYDGVPGVSFPGIRPHESFTYEFPIRQAGTYWWHSHSGLQEQAGHYGLLIIEAADRSDAQYDR